MLPVQWQMSSELIDHHPGQRRDGGKTMRPNRIKKEGGQDAEASDEANLIMQALSHFPLSHMVSMS